MVSPVCVQYGCGFSAPKNWINYDCSPTLFFEKIPVIGRLYTRKSKDKKLRFPKNVIFGDIVKGLPYAENSIDLLYCSHVLEHLSYQDCLIALEHSYQYLKPGGTFRLVLPDLKEVIDAYSNDLSEDAAHHFMRNSYLGCENRSKTIKSVLFSWLSNAHHLWLWDEKAMRKALVNAGFINVKRAFFNDSKDIKFQEVEEKKRWDGCLGFQMSK